ncbi:hypothetical protein NC652_005098 [Populus alba x Populus x berolinensis]|nr:hypothetical protein NC652_005098 [Populus alba x Populus x berolinensis]
MNNWWVAIMMQASTRRKHGLQDASEGDVGGSTQGGDGKEVGRFMELGSSTLNHVPTLSVSTQLLQGKFANWMFLEATGSSSTLFMKQRAYKTWNESMKKPCT